MSDIRSRLEQALGSTYRIERELGGGGMSQVFLAEEIALGRRVVVKVLPEDMAAGVNAERFQREIRLVAGLQHPNIVPLIAAGAQGTLLWFTMPYVDGESLRARINRQGELPIGEAVRIWNEVLDALSYAHQRGVVHRDIKPENVLLSGRHALVADFGVAKALSTATGEIHATATGIALGTPAYMAPEQAAGDPGTDHRADVYAAGLLMYEMLCGRGPFGDRTPAQLLAAHATQSPAPLREQRDQMSPALESLVMSCLAKRPADRPQSADAVMSLLAAVPDVTPTAATSGVTVATTATAARREPRRRWMVGGAVAAALAAAAIAAAIPRMRSPGAEVPLGPIADSARVAVLVLPVVHEASDSILARSALNTVLARVGNDRRILVFRPEAMPLFRVSVAATEAQLSRDTLLRWAPDLGVHTHFTLSLARAGSGYLVGATVQGLARDSALLTMQLAAPSVADVPAAVDEVAAQTTRALAAAFGRIARPRPTGAFWRTTADAADLARQGLEAFERRDYLATTEFLRSSLRVDSTVAFSWWVLALSLSNAGIRTDERLRAIANAYRLRESLPFRDMRMSVESDYLRYTGDDERAIAAALRAEREFGGATNYNNLGLTYARLRRFDDSRRAFERARDTTYLTPSVANTNHVMALIDLGRMDDARREARLLDSLAGRDNAYTKSARILMLRAMRRHDSLALVARRDLEGATSANARIVASSALRDALLTLGRLDEAAVIQRERASEMLALGARETSLNVQLYHAYWWATFTGDTSGAARILDAALAEVPLGTLAPMDRPYPNAISALAAVGRVSQARALAAEADREIPAEFRRVFGPPIEVAKGDLALAENDGRRALTHYRNGDVGPCVPCSYPRFAAAWDALGQRDSALVWYERFLDARSGRLSSLDARYLASAYRRAGELHEDRGNVPRAIERYNEFLALWRDADPRLHAHVEDVRARVARLDATRR